MQMMRALLALRHRPEELFRRVLRVARHKADHKVARNVVDHAEEIGEVHAVLQVFPVGVHVLPEQGDVLIALPHELARLGEHRLRLAGTLAPADIGHDAVGAEIVAAVHDRQPGLHRPVAPHGDALGYRALVPGRRKDALMAPHDALQQLRETPELVRPENQIHHRVGSLDLLGHVLLLHHAAADRDDLRGTGLFGVVERADVAEHAHLGVLAHRAGVDHDHIRQKLVLREAVAHRREIPAQLFAVRLVLLTAVGVHHRERTRAVRRDRIKDLPADPFLPAYLLRGDLFAFVFHTFSFSANSISPYFNIKGMEVSI